MSDPGLALLYQRRMRDWAARVRSDKRLDSPDASITKTSRTCGSSVTLDIRWRGDVILELGWRARACTLGMAATAIVVQHAPGHSFEELEDVGRNLRRLLAGKEAEFSSPWDNLEIFQAARPFTSRHGSILLPFDALADADTTVCR